MSIKIALAGNLKEIKREYGKHCLVLSAMNYSLEQLQEKVVNECGDCVRKVVKGKQFLILTLEENKKKKDLLDLLNQTDIDIEHFGIYEPSLNDIFVETAGEE